MFIFWFDIGEITCLMQAILNIIDSPLNKAGKLRALYVRTEKNVLFEIKPHVRIPRTFKRFAGIMCKFTIFSYKDVEGNYVFCTNERS